MTQKTLTKPFNELTPQELERRKNFDCGEQSLNDYLTNRMRQHDEKNIAKSFLYVVDGVSTEFGPYRAVSTFV